MLDKEISSVAIINRVLRRIAMMRAVHPSVAWYSRVPSALNVAEEASRLKPLVMMQDEAIYR